METFTLEFTADEPKNKNLTGKYQKFDAFYRYRKAESKAHCCANCKHSGYTVIGDRCRKAYKCKLRGIAHSETSDIRLKNICDLYKKEGSQK